MFMFSIKLLELQDEMRLYLIADDQWIGSGTFGGNHQSHQGTVHAVTSSGSLKPSSHYDNGKFHLLLRTSEASGNYSCTSRQADTCSQSSSSSSSVASVLVDDMKARLSVLEAEVRDSKAASSQLDRLTQENLFLQQKQQDILEQNQKLIYENEQPYAEELSNG
ncbi:hypothetical protein ACOMHN_061535 [Nucella lapillus]